MIKVAFQGVHGAYSEIATELYFKGGASPIECPEFADVFRAVTSSRTLFGIIPIENALTGSIHENYDLLLRSKVWIAGEVKLKIGHSLLAHPKAKLKDLRSVYSHPQGLLQCAKFLKRFPKMKATPYFDTAGSAKFIADQNMKESAAIASEAAAKAYGLKVLKRGIADNKINYTRFLILSKTKASSVGRSKTSIGFELKSVPGALHLSLGVFASRSIQLYKIESRPIPGRPWEYLFYLDFEGDFASSVVKAAIEELRLSTRKVKILGSYPIWRE